MRPDMGPLTGVSVKKCSKTFKSIPLSWYFWAIGKDKGLYICIIQDSC